jgi:hypothetical protein
MAVLKNDAGDKTVGIITAAGAERLQTESQVLLYDSAGNALVFKDIDTSGSTEYAVPVTWRKENSGGSLEFGTAGSPVRIDPTGASAQPITDNGGSLTVDATSWPLPTGATTETTLAEVNSRLGDESTPAAGTVNKQLETLNAKDFATETTQATLLTEAGFEARLPAALVGGRLDANTGAWLGSTAPSVGQKAKSASIPVTMASDQPPMVTEVQGKKVTINNGITITGNGNFVVDVEINEVEIVVTYQIDGPVSGTAPTIQFTATDLEPTTLAATTNVSTSPVLTGIVGPAFFSHVSRTGKVKIEWTTGGTAPSFGGVTNTVIPRIESSVALDAKAVPPTGKQIGGHHRTDGLFYRARMSDDPDAGALKRMMVESVLLPGSIRHQISTDNSTTTLLNAGQTFTGAWESCEHFAEIGVMLKVSHESVTDGLVIEQSSDGVNVDEDDRFTVLANAGKIFSFRANGKFFRVLYTNGGTAQTTFRLQTKLHPVRGKPSSHRIQDAIVDQDDAELVKSIITGKKPDGTFDNVSLDNAGALNVISSPGPPPPGVLSELIWGEVVSGGPNLVAVRETAYTEPASAAQRSIASSSANDTSAGTGARTVKITYFDDTLANRLTETVTLNGTTAVNTVATNIRFIERIEVLTSGSANENVGTITLYGSTGGGGGTVGTIAATKRRTNWAHHYVPAGKVLFLASMNGGAKIKEGGRLFGQAKDPTSSVSTPIQVTPTFVLAGLASSIAVTFAVPIAVINGPARFTMFIDAAGNDTFYCGFGLTESDA